MEFTTEHAIFTQKSISIWAIRYMADTSICAGWVFNLKKNRIIQPLITVKRKTWHARHPEGPRVCNPRVMISFRLRAATRNVTLPSPAKGKRNEGWKSWKRNARAV